MGRVLRIGGVVSGIVLIGFGVAVIVLAVWGHHTVTTELKRQEITGTPDMTPSAIKAEAEKAGLTNVDLPTCDVAGKSIDTGSEARCFSQYMNVHALEATGGAPTGTNGEDSSTGAQRSTPVMKACQIEPGSIRPNDQGIAIAKDIWMFAIALGFLIDELAERKR